jgi:4-hydroxy-tetrahydrodipicolinate reductase
MRIVQVGLGPVGIAIARLAAERPGVLLVGAVEQKAAIVGREVGELLGIAGLSIPIEDALEPLLRRSKPDVVLHSTGSFLAEVAEQLEVALRLGVSVVSTCEELAYPFYRHPELAARLDGVAVESGARLLGTGVNPGFVMDKLVATLMGACRSVESVDVRRVVDAATRREPLQRKVGAGMTKDAFEEVRATGRLGHVGLVESAHMLADVMGASRERLVVESVRPKIAERTVVTEYLSVERGQVAGIEHDVSIHEGAKERVRLALRMFVGARNPGDTITIEGSPSIGTRIRGGIHGDAGTAAIVVNGAGAVRALAPGLRTMLDVPLRFLPRIP